MKLIDYAKYQTKWSPRSTIIWAIVEAVITGFFLGMSLSEAVAGHEFWKWAWLLTLGFASGIGTLQATLLVLHAFSLKTKSPQNEAPITSGA